MTMSSGNKNGCATIGVYVKAQKAHSSDDCERWEEAATSGTLAAHSATSGTLAAHSATSGTSDLSVRRLTPFECERLMGLPDGWTEGQADSVRYRQCGNAVVVPVAEWIGRRLLAYDHHHGDVAAE